MNREDIIKVLKGALIAGGGAALAYLTEYITGADFGEYTEIVVAGWAVVVNAARKFILQRFLPRLP